MRLSSTLIAMLSTGVSNRLTISRTSSLENDHQHSNGSSRREPINTVALRVAYRISVRTQIIQKVLVVSSGKGSMYSKPDQ